MAQKYSKRCKKTVQKTLFLAFLKKRIFSKNSPVRNRPVAKNYHFCKKRNIFEKVKNDPFCIYLNMCTIAKMVNFSNFTKNRQNAILSKKMTFFKIFEIKNLQKLFCVKNATTKRSKISIKVTFLKKWIFYFLTRSKITPYTYFL